MPETYEQRAAKVLASEIHQKLEELRALLRKRSDP